MVKKVREENIPLINYISEVKDGDVSDNQDVQRYYCSDKSFVNGIGVTVLTGDYLPPLILAEVPLGEGLVQKYIVDGLQRTTAIMMIRYGNHKFTGTIEDSEIEYQTKKLDENGVAVKDEEGNFIWEKEIFDIKNKTYDEFPKELKKRIDTYQLRVATYQNCTMEKVSKLVRKLNQHKSMNVSQQSITWIPTYARKIKQIADGKFFKDTIEYKDTYRKNGEYLQVVCRSVMNIFHFDNYKKEAKKIANYLEDNSSMNEFNIVQNHFDRIGKVCGDRFKDIFEKKNIPIWIVVFNKFTKLGLPDEKFVEFLDALKRELHNKNINGTNYDELNKLRGTTDKCVVSKKIEVFTTLMMKFLQIEEKNENDSSKNSVKLIDSEDKNAESVLSFVQENANPDATEEDIEFYRDMVEDCVKVDEPVYQQCERAVIAIMAYACMKEQDEEFEKWIQKYKNQTNFSPSQKTNFAYMKNSFDKYVQKGATA
jgi:hypothetical protein